MKWLDLKKSIPEDPLNRFEEKRYLVLINDFWPEISYYSGKGCWEFSNVSHWMDIPENIKEQNCFECAKCEKEFKPSDWQNDICDDCLYKRNKS